MSNVYGNMMDSAFGPYYERFRALKATSKETAVPRNQILPEGESLRDKDAMHKMLSTGVVKRGGIDRQSQQGVDAAFVHHSGCCGFCRRSVAASPFWYHKFLIFP